MPTALLVGGLVAGLLTGGAAAPAASSAALVADDVRLRFDAPWGVVTAVGNAGTAATRQRIVTANGGRLLAVGSVEGWGRAARFPTYDGSAGGARAVVAVRNAGATDQLSPGRRRFAFGAMMRLDRGDSVSVYDNGNNLIQRGLYHAPAQFKIQVDGDHPSCRVKGAAGAVTVVSPVAVTRGAWYGLACWRAPGTDTERVNLSVTPIAVDGSRGRTVTASTAAVVGAVRLPLATPLSVGGKLNPDSTIARESDQFNGVVDNAFLRIS